MRLLRFCAVALLGTLVPVARACEGDCIVGITKAFLRNYTRPVGKVFEQLGQDVCNQLIPPASRPRESVTVLLPILKAYANLSYASLENAIFPSYFHGKCNRFSSDGKDPKGCPNPDCPVVCGTPGSLVHFYSTLRFIAFNDTRSALESLVDPDSKPFAEVLKIVEERQTDDTSYSAKRFSRGSSKRGRLSSEIVADVQLNATEESALLYSSYDTRSENHLFSRFPVAHNRAASSKTAVQLAAILGQVGSLLARACGGHVTATEGGLPKCSWRDAMIQYILSYP